MTAPFLPQGWVEYVLVGTLVVIGIAFLVWVLAIVLLQLDSLFLHIIGGTFS